MALTVPGLLFCHGMMEIPSLWAEFRAHAVDRGPAVLDGFGLRQMGPWSVAVPEAGAVVTGHLVDIMDMGPIDYVMAVLGQKARPVAVTTPHGPRTALCHIGVADDAGSPWVRGTDGDGPDGDGSYGDGPDGDGPDRLRAAMVADIIALDGKLPVAVVAARLGPMLVRAASRLRAEDASGFRVSRLRHRSDAGDVQIGATRFPYAQFFAMEEYDVAWRQFDGTLGASVTRAAFVLGDAVTVLPYDPVRDRVLVIEQFRAGPLARGDREHWQIEPIAGRIDPGETPQMAARREAVEEAGLTLDRLIAVASYYPSPGAVSEFIYSYVALTPLPDGSAGIFGLEDEAEDIRGHLISFDTLMELVATGEVANAPLIMTALWLQRERPQLRGNPL